jgi:hypothetical protein
MHRSYAIPWAKGRTPSGQLPEGPANIPVADIGVRLRLPERVHRVVQPLGERPIPHTEADAVIRFTVPRLETLAMCAAVVE